MNELEKALHRLPKIDPEEGFVRMSKQRLMHQIQLFPEEKTVFDLLKESKDIEPPLTFVNEARQRLMYHIQKLPSPVKISLKGLAYTLNVLKKAVASSLVMVIAVTATLFYVEGNTVVEASDDSYLEVLSGKASVKHANMLAWETVSNRIELQAGDLIRLKDDAQAIIHFFDDSQVRLNENSTLLISQLVVSPAFAGQGIIEVNLNEGEAWVQTLNVEDGYAHFSLSTPDGMIKSLHGSFNVARNQDLDTEVTLFDGKAELFQLDPITQQTVGKTKLIAGQKVMLAATSTFNISVSHLSEEDKNKVWIQKNLERNAFHLASLRSKDLNDLTLVAGTLPGDMLYFIKKAKEDLKLAWNDDTDLSLKIQIANQRLNEAIILLENGDHESARQALSAYQSLAVEIAQANKTGESSTLNKKLANQLIVPHQKFLNAQTSNESTVMIKETLHKTAELLAETPWELASIKLRNSLDKLEEAKVLVESGDFAGAKEKLSSYATTESNLIETLNGVQNPEDQKKAIEEALALKEEQKTILTSVTEQLEDTSEGDSELLAMLRTASTDNETELNATMIAALPLFPELADSAKPSLSPLQSSGLSAIPASNLPETTSIADKINLYNTWQGQMNQIERLLSKKMLDPLAIEELRSIRNQLSGARARSYLGMAILRLENQIAAEKNAEIENAATAITSPEETADLQEPETSDSEPIAPTTEDPTVSTPETAPAPEGEANTTDLTR